MEEFVRVEWLIVTGCFLGSLLLTPLIRHYARCRHLVDVPNTRSSHVRPTPRGGGLAIAVSCIAGLVILTCLHRFPFDLFSTLTGAGILVAAVGFMDDHVDISARWRVLAHFAAAVWIVISFNGFFMQYRPSPSEWFLDLFWIISIVWLINLYNFMDGIDTIAGAEAVFVSISATALFAAGGEYGMASAAALLTVAVGGFLFWNLPPARIFMGDVGSGFIGVVIGAFALAGIKHGTISIWVWLILLGVFLVDSTITVGRRIMRGQKWYSAHRSHAYQHGARRLGSHGKVTAIVTGINVFWLFPWALAAYRWPNLGPLFALFAYIPLLWLVVRIGAGIDETMKHDTLGFSQKGV